MNKIVSITDDALQTQTLILPDGSGLQLSIYYVPMQYGWFITNLKYGTFILKGLRISNSPNMLHQFRNKIPFGLACFSQSDREPSFQNDFKSGASSLFVLTAAEVKQYAGILSGQ